MKASIQVLMVLGALAAPAAVRAATPLQPPPGHVAHRLAGARHAIRRPDLASDVGPTGQDPVTRAGVSTPAVSDFPRTAVDYHLAPDGMTGSVGYLCNPFSPPLAGREAVMSAASRYGRASSFLGAKLSYAFK